MAFGAALLFLAAAGCRAAEAPGPEPTARVHVLSWAAPAKLAVAAPGLRVGGVAVPGGRLAVAADGSRLALSPPVPGTHAARLVLDAPGGVLELVWGRQARLYRGSLELDARDGVLRPVIALPFEAYVAAVTFAETPPLSGIAVRDEPFLAAQAVCVRSYALHHLARGERHPDGPAPFCDLTHCQVYRGDPPAAYAGVLGRAVAATRGLVLVHGGRLVPGWYSSACGGATTSPDVAWGAARDAAVDDPDLAFFRLAVVPVEDTLPGAGRPLCAGAPFFAWTHAVPEAVFAAWFGTTFFPIDRYADLVVAEAAPGRPATLARAGQPGQAVSAYAFRNAYCKTFGWNTLLGLRWTAAADAGTLRFRGRGFGHGVGLCQYGAAALAAAGKPWRDIIAWYFPRCGLAARWYDPAHPSR